MPSPSQIPDNPNKVYTVDELVARYTAGPGTPGTVGATWARIQPDELVAVKNSLLKFKSPNVTQFASIVGDDFYPKHIQEAYTSAVVYGNTYNLEYIITNLKEKVRPRAQYEIKLITSHPQLGVKGAESSIQHAEETLKLYTSHLEESKKQGNEKNIPVHQYKVDQATKALEYAKSRIPKLASEQKLATEIITEVDYLLPLFEKTLAESKKNRRFLRLMAFRDVERESEAFNEGMRDAYNNKSMDPVFAGLTGSKYDNIAIKYASGFQYGKEHPNTRILGGLHSRGSKTKVRNPTKSNLRKTRRTKKLNGRK